MTEATIISNIYIFYFYALSQYIHYEGWSPWESFDGSVGTGGVIVYPAENPNLNDWHALLDILLPSHLGILGIPMVFGIVATLFGGSKWVLHAKHCVLDTLLIDL